MSPTAPPQTSRSSNACEPCRRRKAKCSGKQPCESCTRQSIDCTFVAIGRRGYSEAYVQSLLATIKRQKRQLNEKRSRPQTPTREDEQSEDTSTFASKPSGEKPGPLRSLSEPLSMHPATELTPGPAFESRVRSLLRHHAESSQSPLPPQAGIQVDQVPNQWQDLRGLIEDVPPPAPLTKETSAHLFELFMSLMGVNQHFLDPRNFEDSLTVLHESESSRALQMDTMWYTQYLLVMAIGMLIGSPSQGSHNPPGGAYFAEAMRRFPPLYDLGTHGVIAVEVLCLITVYLQWCDLKHDAYLYIGTAVRLALALGCALPRVEQKGLASEVCHRVRLWWTAYMLDRRLSAGLGLSMSVDDRHIRAELPYPSPGFQPPLPLEINVRIAQVTGNIMTSLYGNAQISQNELVQKVQDIIMTLHETVRSIPTALAIDFSEPDIPVTRTGASLYLMMFQAKILCIRPIILQCVKEKVQYSKAGQPSTPVISVISRLCHLSQAAAIKSIRILTALQKQKTLALFGYFDLDATFSAAFVLLMMGFITNNDPRKPPEGLEEAARVLEYLSSSGNKAAERRLKDLKQFCYHVWSPDKMSEEWKWLTESHAATRNRSRETADTSRNLNGSCNAGRTQTPCLEQKNPGHSFWPEVWDDWFSELATSQNSMVLFEAAEGFELDLKHEADEIYAKFNDPNLPLTGVDEMDWAEMEKIFQFKGV